jgi:hypothetical protein
MESNLGGTTGAITRPFAGRVFFVCVDPSVPQNSPPYAGSTIEVFDTGN